MCACNVSFAKYNMNWVLMTHLEDRGKAFPLVPTCDSAQATMVSVWYVDKTNLPRNVHCCFQEIVGTRHSVTNLHVWVSWPTDACKLLGLSQSTGQEGLSPSCTAQCKVFCFPSVVYTSTPCNSLKLCLLRHSSCQVFHMATWGERQHLLESYNFSPDGSPSSLLAYLCGGLPCRNGIEVPVGCLCLDLLR